MKPQVKFVPIYDENGRLKGRAPFLLLEKDIRIAMANSLSNEGAAKYLCVNSKTYKKYASLYIDKETGKTLYEIHCNKGGKGIKSGKPKPESSAHFLQRLELGKMKSVNKSSILKRLIFHALLPEKCAICGFDERDLITYRVPLILDFIDGDYKNFKLTNLRALCPNHYSLLVGRVTANQDRKKEDRKIPETKKESPVKLTIDYEKLTPDTLLSPEEIKNLDLTKL